MQQAAAEAGDSMATAVGFALGQAEYDQGLLTISSAIIKQLDPTNLGTVGDLQALGTQQALASLAFVQSTFSNLQAALASGDPNAQFAAQYAYLTAQMDAADVLKAGSQSPAGSAPAPTGGSGSAEWQQAELTVSAAIVKQLDPTNLGTVGDLQALGTPQALASLSLVQSTFAGLQAALKGGDPNAQFTAQYAYLTAQMDAAIVLGHTAGASSAVVSPTQPSGAAGQPFSITTIGNP